MSSLKTHGIYCQNGHRKQTIAHLVEILPEKGVRRDSANTLLARERTVWGEGGVPQKKIAA